MTTDADSMERYKRQNYLTYKNKFRLSKDGNVIDNDIVPPTRTGKREDVDLYFRYCEDVRIAFEWGLHRGSLEHLTTSRLGIFDASNQEIPCMAYKNTLDELLTGPGPVRSVINRGVMLELQDALGTVSTVEFLEQWKQLDSIAREEIWPSLMIAIARDAPHRLLKLLSGTWLAPYPPTALM